MKNKISKHLLATAAIALLLWPASGMANEGAFSDVTDTHENSKAINELKARGVIKGTSPTEFEPEGEINRAAALKMILKGFELYDPEVDGNESEDPKDINFKDIKDSSWFVPYVRYAVNSKVLSGYNDGTFKPGRSINRAEGLKIIINILDEDGAKSFSKHHFNDVARKDWFNHFFAYAESKNIFLPNLDANGEPGKPLTRAELAEIIYRVRMIKEKNWDSYKLQDAWSSRSFPSLRSKISIPKGWQVTENGNEAVVWFADSERKQNSHQMLYPRSARFTIFVDNPDMDRKTYFANVKKMYSSESEAKESGNDLTVRGDGFMDRYRFISKNTAVVSQGRYGQGSSSFYNTKKIEAVTDSFVLEDGETVVDKKEELLSSIRASIQSEGQGKNILSKLEDEKIISTDTIGVGTGPVDYYYSPFIGHTIKYERSFDVILDLRAGETDKF